MGFLKIIFNMETCEVCRRVMPSKEFYKTHMPCPEAQVEPAAKAAQTRRGFLRAVQDVAFHAHDGMVMDDVGADAPIPAAAAAPPAGAAGEAQPPNVAGAGIELNEPWRVTLQRVVPLEPATDTLDQGAFEIVSKCTEYMHTYKLTRIARAGLWSLVLAVCSFTTVYFRCFFFHFILLL
jgi:hypothetical protein